MSVRNLEHLFRPDSVAVIGATDRAGSVGHAVMRNLLRGGFAGPIMPVHPRHRAVSGVLAYDGVASLPLVPELAVVCTPAPTVPGIIAELGARGTRAAVVLTAGLTRARVEDGRTLQQAMLDAARPHLLRILGPNCLGLIVPGLGLDASFAHISALPGQVALIHQSGALCTALLDWARSNGIGFSHFVSIGDAADVDFGDALDYLGSDPAAKAILLYIESVSAARKFMSAARAAARNKPVVVVKAGRAEEGAKAAASHTGALAGRDDVYDAAFARAGMLRVYDTAEMFDAVETLAHSGSAPGERLAILTNGGGPGVIATDALMLAGGRLATLSAETVARLDAVLPDTWSRGNPVDIIGDAGGDRYAAALEILLGDDTIDAVLVLHAPTAVVSSLDAAQAVIAVIERHRARDRVLASWLGAETVRVPRQRLTEAGIPSYETPDSAVRGFLHRIRHHRSQALLMETPPSVPEAFQPAVEAARIVVQRALAEGRETLTEPEAKAVLSAYAIPVVDTRIARTPDDVMQAAMDLGGPVAIKVLSDDISHKSDVGGVVLDLENPAAAHEAAVAMAERVATLRPDARLSGFTVQTMARRPGAYELIVGATTDAIFGPVILFGEGGVAVEVIGDRAVALPPLNMKLAGELIERTRVARRLHGYRDHAAVDLQAVSMTLIKIGQLVTDLAEIAEVDINPLIADSHGVLALDARMQVRSVRGAGADRLAIRPYPSALEERVTLGDLKLLLRPIRPEDEARHKEFLERLAPEDVRFRFFGQVREFAHSQLARFTQIDYDREMAFIATDPAPGSGRTLGVVRAVCDPDNARAEFAIVVSSELKGRGLGHTLLEKMLRYLRARGTDEVVGEVLASNEAMLNLARRLGFEVTRASGEAVSVRLAL
ncbi:MAG: bifunctional acetate--CoA ligase family protein/GNAT family N-acetyltransferase [Ectothiorhodospiraceae bacterium]|nr:bifunctional acetate--CoA ligase family protein/GNAT family N-acetyltransferase [Ectothiorhodospiraceae bacterium]